MEAPVRLYLFEAALYGAIGYLIAGPAGGFYGVLFIGAFAAIVESIIVIVDHYKNFRNRKSS